MTYRLRTLCLLACLGVPAWSAAAEIDESALPVSIEPAFANLKFNRPIFLTGAADGSNRVFVPSQLGVIHVFPNDPRVSEAKVFMDLSKRVVYKDTENEEGLLGLAFHPKFATNGEFFVYYTTTAAPHTSVVSRFRVKAGDSSQGDLASEEELMRVPQPFWNHNGGTICFGPDGYLYIALGDGGSGNDPEGNGQFLGTVLGKILRIDVDRKDPGLAYAIPKDNPFVGQKDARPEIWAYGLRNVWRMAFDPETGLLWAGDVGQDFWEEIDIIVRGGNYGWNAREGLHPFVPKVVNGVSKPAGNRPPPAGAELLDPVFEYHHDIGRSITGGAVYRGHNAPSLVGKYLYADYVTGKVYALDYDVDNRVVRGNRAVPGNIQPVMSFGEDDNGEQYFMTTEGKLHWFRENK